MSSADLADIEAAVSEGGLPAQALAVAFDRLLRNKPSDLAAHLTVVEANIEIPGTAGKSHCHVVSLDVRGKARVSLLVDHLVTHLVDYAIPRKRIREAAEDLIETGSSKKFVKLTMEARSLFTDIATTGEGGELLLYVLAEAVLQHPQIITKMSLKTASRMHYHGADGVHGAMDAATGILTLYWGEAKVRSDPKQAITSCLTDLRPFLVSEDGAGSPRDRDLHLLSENADLDDPQVEAALRAYLDPDNLLSKLVKHAGIGVAGFNCVDYDGLTGPSASETLMSSVQNSAQAWRDHLKERIEKLDLHMSDVHFFCVPMPDVDIFRATFLKRLGVS